MFRCSDGDAPIIHADYNFVFNNATFLLTKTQLLLFREILFSWISPATKTFIPSLLNDVFNNQGFTEASTSNEKNVFAPLMNIDLKDFTFHFVDMKELQGISVCLGSIRATVQNMDETQQFEETLFFQSPCKTIGMADVDTWLSKSPEKESCNCLVIKVQYQKTASPSKFVQLADVQLSGASINIDPLFFKWFAYQVDFQAKRRIKSVRTHGTSLLSQSITTPRRTKSYVRVFGGSNTSQSQQSKSRLEDIEELNIEDTDEGKKQRFGEWIVQKINFFKSFHIRVNLKPIVMIFPQARWPQGCNQVDHVDMMRSIYNSANSIFPPTMVLCSPDISINSSKQDDNLFDQSLPLLLLQKRRGETLPWTISGNNMALYCLFPKVEEVFLDGKFENIYICKPMSWNIYLASVLPNKTVSSKDSTLEIITEVENGSKQKDKGFYRSVWTAEKHSSIESKYMLGFVLHMDCSIFEIFVSHSQLKLGSGILNNVYHAFNSLSGIRENRKTTSLSQNETGFILKDETHAKYVDSPSTSSVVEQVDAFSTITGSSTVMTKQKVFVDDIKVSLWIQCTLPKIKCTFLSRVGNENSFYKVVSEIEEIMFAFDYQDNVLELTNKIASCVIYYSLLRFDCDPKGWVITDDGYLLCQKEKFRVSGHSDSKTLLSVVYRRTHHYSQSILSPELADPQKTSEPSLANAPLLLQDDHVVKHEMTVHLLSFDVICYSKPILSSLAIFTNLTAPIRSSQHVKNASAEIQHMPQNSLVTLPIFSVHCDSVRVIIPVGETEKLTSQNAVDFLETIFVFHFLSVDLNSSPSNPITKTVTDKTLYRHVKLNHRDSLKKLKLWNVQYQLDILNVGLCTTNWRSLEGSLPSKFKQIQNPALEWNSKSSYGQSKMTPVFPGFDFKATIAPPVIVEINQKMHPITAAALEIHSPREMKIFVSSYQVGLALQVMDDINSLISEMNLLLKSISGSAQSSEGSIETINTQGENITNDSGIQTKTFEDNTRFNSEAIGFPSVECFASVSCITIIIYEKHYHQPLTSTVYPTLYLNLLQPTFTLTSIKEKKAVITLLNCSIRTSSNNIGIKGDVLVPSLADFNLEFISCGKGLMNPQTGLPPTFLTIAANLNEGNQISVDMHIGKPLYLKYFAYADQNLRNFFKKLAEILNGRPPTKPNLHSMNKTEEVHHLDLFSFHNFTLSTQCICLSGSTSIGTNVNFQCQLFMATATMENQNINLNSTIDITTKFKGLEIFFSDDQVKKRAFLMPANVELHVFASFCAHSGNLESKSSLPRLFVWLDSRFLQICANQHLYQLIKKFTDEVTDLYLKCNEDINFSSHEMHKVSSQKNNCELKTSIDDLRNGQLEYIIQDGTTKIPDVNQILFTEENNNKPVMTWKYPEARKIKEIVVLPVPFHVSNDIRSCWIEDTEVIPCLLQYWDEMSNSFISWQRFFLSENESSSLNFDMASSSVISSMWRVVVVVPEEISRHQENNSFIEDMCCPVPSTSLAACMKVSSEHSAELVPSLQLKIRVETLKISVSNFIEYKEKVLPTQLTPFYMTECGPEMVEALCVSIDELTSDLSMINASTSSLNVSCKVNMNVMDYNNYYWLNVLNPTSVTVHITHEQCHVPTTDLNLKVGETDIYMSQTVVHTLSKTINAWKNFGNENEEIIFYSHYILSNHTQDVLHIKQMNTDEDILLRSGQAYPYSWYSTKDEFLCFAIESVGDWVWSDPIDINQTGIFARKIDHANSASLVFVEIKVIGGLQKQVIFHGSCVFVNNLCFDLQMGVITQETIHNRGVSQSNVREVSKTFSLPAGVTRPSLTICMSFIKSLKITKIDEGNEGNSSFEFPLVLNSEEEHHCIQLKDGLSNMYNLWLSLTYNTKIIGQLIITVSPLFVLRSYLAEPVLINISDKEMLSNCCDMILHGRGREQQIFAMKEKHSYSVSFCLAGSKEYSKPPFSLNTTLFDLLREDPKNLSSNVTMKWPYIDQLTEISPSSSSHHKVSYKAVMQSDGNIMPQEQTTHNWQEGDLVFQTNLRWEHLPTVMLDLKPWILITNLAQVDLEIRSYRTGYVYSLEKNQTISPFHIKSSFQIGVHSEGGTLWSPEISISNDMEDGGIQKDETLKPGSFFHCSVMENNKNRCHQFSLLCSQTEGIMLIHLRERFVIHNLSNESLLMLPLMSEDFKSQIFDTLSGLLLPPRSVTTCASLNINGKDAINVPSDLIMNFKKRADMKTALIHKDNECTVSNHLVKTIECFHLSKDHLRESIVLGDCKCRSELIATSSLEQGAIHVFIDTNCSPIVTITNDSSFPLAVMETTEVLASKPENRYDILCSERDLLTLLTPHSNTKYFSKAFKDMFPSATM